MEFKEVHKVIRDLVVYRFQRIPPFIVDFDDLYQEAMLAAYKIMDNYDPEKNLRTFLWLRVNGAITDYLRATDSLTRATRTALKTLITRQEQEAHRLYAYMPLDYFANTREKVLLDYSKFEIISLEDKMQDTFEGTTGGYILPSKDGNLEKLLHEGFMICQMERRLKRFSIRERNIFIMYYYQEMTLINIGKIYKISEGRVSQLKDKVKQDMQYHI